jgi:anti-sigma B factor antagonist
VTSGVPQNALNLARCPDEQDDAMQIDVRNVYDVLVVDMAGRLDSQTAGVAGDRMTEIVQGDHKKIVLNLQNLEYVSSAGLRIILRASKLLQGLDGEFRICNATGLVRAVLDSAGFSSLLKTYDTEKDAVSSFST